MNYGSLEIKDLNIHTKLLITPSILQMVAFLLRILKMWRLTLHCFVTMFKSNIQVVYQ